VQERADAVGTWSMEAGGKGTALPHRSKGARRSLKGMLTGLDLGRGTACGACVHVCVCVWCVYVCVYMRACMPMPLVSPIDEPVVLRKTASCAILCFDGVCARIKHDAEEGKEKTAQARSSCVH